MEATQEQKQQLGGDEVDALQRTPLHLASANGEIEIVQALVEKNTSSCMVRDLNGLIPLHHAVINDQIKVMHHLIDVRPQSMWMKLSNGQTILHFCVKNNRLEALKLLITILITIFNDEQLFNVPDNDENTILDLSMMFRRIEMVRYLLSVPGIKTGTNNHNETSSTRIEEECYDGSSTSSTPQRLITTLWKNNGLQYKGDWIQEMQNTMMLVATVIATVTFQGAMNPPGGLWQQDFPFNSNATTISRSFHSTNPWKVFVAGTAIMAYPTSVQQSYGYTSYLVTNSISFFASICVIMFIISRLPLKNRICASLLTIAMCVEVASLSYSYLVGVWIINVSYRNSYVLKATFIVAFFIWLGMIGVVVSSCIIIPLLSWVVKLLT